MVVYLRHTPTIVVFQRFGVSTAAILELLLFQLLQSLKP